MKYEVKPPTQIYAQGRVRSIHEFISTPERNGNFAHKGIIHNDLHTHRLQDQDQIVLQRGTGPSIGAEQRHSEIDDRPSIRGDSHQIRSTAQPVSANPTLQ